jgi:aminotransferase EvaB
MSSGIKTVVPFNDLRRRFEFSLEDEICRDFRAIIKSGTYIGGPIVEDFEKDFARFCGADHCIAVANGTDALEVALRACGVERGDEVATVANAGGYATTACSMIGAKPVLVDVDACTCQMDLRSLEQVLTEKTKAVVVTHLYGFMNDVLAVRALLQSAGRQSVSIVEDCAQAHGASLGEARAGSLGDAAAFSFYPTKNMGALGDAGAIVSSRPDVALRASQLRQYGWQSKYDVVTCGGRNSRMDPVQAIVLSRQIALLDEANRARRDVCRVYQENLPAGWNLVYDKSGRFVAHLAVVQAPNTDARHRAFDILSERGIGHGVHFPILDCDQPGWQGLFCQAADLPVSRRLKDVILSVPCFPELNDREIDEITNALRALA